MPPIRPAALDKSQIPALYTWIAPTHDALAVLVEARARALGLAWAAVQNGEDVLEVGVGTGLNFARLLARNPDGWTEGVDLTPAMLRRARRRAHRAGHHRWRLGVGDAYALPYPEASFDLVVNSYMFDLLPVADFPVVLGEFGRVLRPGGRLVQMNMTVGERPQHRLWEGLYRLHPALLGGCRGVRVAPQYPAAGFESVRRAYIVQWGFPSEVVHGRRPA